MLREMVTREKPTMAGPNRDPFSNECPPSMKDLIHQCLDPDPGECASNGTARVSGYFIHPVQQHCPFLLALFVITSALQKKDPRHLKCIMLSRLWMMVHPIDQ